VLAVWDCVGESSTVDVATRTKGELEGPGGIVAAVEEGVHGKPDQLNMDFGDAKRDL
jgi:hypothetical protein